jgi:teichuronic acid biosynthesis glycosyltransferase TuaG
LISIIIATYNRSELLKKTLQSIIDQTFKEFEIIVVDDGSSDNTETVVKEFKDYDIKYLKLENSGNIAKIRNTGIQHSKYDVLAFCDDDDIWEKNKLERQLPLLNKFDMICCNGNIIDLNDNLIKNKYYDIKEDFLITPEILIKNNLILTPTVLLKKEIVRLNNFEEAEYKNLCEDYYLWLQIVFDFSIYFLNENLVKIRRHLSTTQNLKNKILVELNLIKILTPFKNSNVRSIKNAAYESIFNKKYYLLRSYREQKKYFTFLAELIKLCFSLLNYKNLIVFINKIKCSSTLKIKKILQI